MASKVDLSKIHDHPVGKPDEADSKTKSEENDLDAQRTKVELDGLLQDIAERKKYASRIFCLLSLWLIGIFLLLVLQGTHQNGFHLSDNVLIAAIGGTTVNVIGIFIVVTRYLFPSAGSLKKK